MPTVILFQHRSPGPAEQALERELVAALANRPGITMAVLPHVYDLAPGGPAVGYLRSLEGDLIALGWLYPRAIYWLLRAHGVAGRMGETSLAAKEDRPRPGADAGETGSERTISCLDLRGHQDAAVLLAEVARIVETRAEAGGEARAAASPVSAGIPAEVQEVSAPRWYPVIDYGRCSNCLECLNFCLFGTFGLDEAGHIIVEAPDTCRDGCPACSRICPAGAILFPEHADPAIAGGPGTTMAAAEAGTSQFLVGREAQQLAAAERQRAMGDTITGTTGQSPDSDALDRLVDELDETEL